MGTDVIVRDHPVLFSGGLFLIAYFAFFYFTMVMPTVISTWAGWQMLLGFGIGILFPTYFFLRIFGVSHEYQQKKSKYLALITPIVCILLFPFSLVIVVIYSMIGLGVAFTRCEGESRVVGKILGLSTLDSLLLTTLYHFGLLVLTIRGWVHTGISMISIPFTFILGGFNVYNIRKETQHHPLYKPILLSAVTGLIILPLLFGAQYGMVAYPFGAAIYLGKKYGKNMDLGLLAGLLFALSLAALGLIFYFQNFFP